MKKWENNLMVIENFIDYYTSNNEEREKLKQIAKDYIEEDHVDGKDED